ncbi:MAG: DNA replication/repair protein RecF [candidate division KSB1 bacterium]|nr:DNA replication/repair protein RecF [candidate division KSB1 bacterium]MDZ7301962.1 DNA replication/repair protein RecF [candidate division KSB1 bacterium]MDZ7312367.1 DNA replication/repair protein RecF [candidate division KSB1 bacterium]
MIIRKLRLLGFRNYAQLELTFSATTNFIYGPNAQGKSNLLEAIYFLSVTRGFRAVADQELMKFDAGSFEVTGEYVDERQTNHLLTICYHKDNGKQISLDGKRVNSHAALVGKFPIVLFSPESHRITAGPPAERRRFLDVLLSQGSSGYLADLQEYNRIVRQRNALLMQYQKAGANTTDRMLAAWDESLALYGCKIIQARYRFVQDNAEFLNQAYKQISASSDSLQIAYRSQFEALAGEPEKITPARFQECLGAHRRHERQRAQTLVGPHRDDVDMSINGANLRKYGSRGEHKSTLMALKMMEAEYLKRRLKTAPIILLDDLISELDETRIRQCVQFFAGRGQLFLSAVAQVVYPVLQDAAKFRVESGSVVMVN